MQGQKFIHQIVSNLHSSSCYTWAQTNWSHQHNIRRKYRNFCESGISRPNIPCLAPQQPCLVTCSIGAEDNVRNLSRHIPLEWKIHGGESWIFVKPQIIKNQFIKIIDLSSHFFGAIWILNCKLLWNCNCAFWELLPQNDWTRRLCLWRSKASWTLNIRLISGLAWRITLGFCQADPKSPHVTVDMSDGYLYFDL